MAEIKATTEGNNGVILRLTLFCKYIRTQEDKTRFSCELFLLRELPFLGFLNLNSGSKEDISKLDWDVGLRHVQCFTEKIAQINWNQNKKGLSYWINYSPGKGLILFIPKSNFICLIGTI